MRHLHLIQELDFHGYSVKKIKAILKYFWPKKFSFQAYMQMRQKGGGKALGYLTMTPSHQNWGKNKPGTATAQYFLSEKSLECRNILTSEKLPKDAGRNLVFCLVFFFAYSLNTALKFNKCVGVARRATT